MIDEWLGPSGGTYAANRTLSGRHELRVEYYEASGLASLWFDIAGYNQSPAWRAEYFANTALAGRRRLSSKSALLVDSAGARLGLWIGCNWRAG